MARVNGVRALSRLQDRLLDAPSWVHQTALLSAIFVAVMVVVATAVPGWHGGDARFFEWVASPKIVTDFSPDAVVVELTTWEDGRPEDRLLLAHFLDRMIASKQRPQAVVFDLQFVPCTRCGGAVGSARAALVAALQRAKHVGILVYGIKEPLNANLDKSQPLAEFDPLIYANLAGAGHSQSFELIPENPRDVFYRMCYAPGGGLNDDLWALAQLMRPNFDPADGCDTSHRSLLLPAPLPHRPPFFYSVSDAKPFPAGANFNKKYLVLGAPRDFPSDRTGPELVAWEMSEVLARTHSSPDHHDYEVTPANGLLVFLVPAFSAITVLAFAALFFVLSRLRLPGLRAWLPSLCAVLSAALGVAALAALEALILELGRIQPQVTLILIGIVVSAALSAVRARQIMFEELHRIDPRVPEQYDHDVFLSYAHDDQHWVKENVLRPLEEAKLGSGRPLKIFFDRRAIRIGTFWQRKIALSIDHSKFFIAVYTERYPDRPFCRYELRRAYRKWILSDGSQNLFPIVRGAPKLLEDCDDLQYVNLEDESELIAEIVARIIAALSTEKV